jgi:hypothetical protein
MHRDEFPNARANMSPAFPVATSDTAPNPLFQACEQFQLRGKGEVTHPTSHVACKFAQAMLHRNPAATPGDLANAMLEAMNGFRGHAERHT